MRRTTALACIALLFFAAVPPSFAEPYRPDIDWRDQLVKLTIMTRAGDQHVGLAKDEPIVFASATVGKVSLTWRGISHVSFDKAAPHKATVYFINGDRLIGRFVSAELSLINFDGGVAVACKDIRTLHVNDHRPLGSTVGLSRGLVLYYPFDGDLNDASGHGQHASPIGATAFAGGVRGKALRLGGIDKRGYLRVSNTEHLRFKDAMTISCWVRLTGKASTTAMDCTGPKVADGIHCVASQSGERVGWTLKTLGEHLPKRVAYFGAYAFSSANTGVRGDDPAEVGRWTHLAAVSGKHGVKLYMNGNLVAETSKALDFTKSNGEDLYIGTQLGKGSCGRYWYPWLGEIDELRIHNRALSAAEIESLYGQVRVQLTDAR